MATISDTKDDIKADVKELVDIVIEDKIPKERIEECHSFADIITQVYAPTEIRTRTSGIIYYRD